MIAFFFFSFFSFFFLLFFFPEGKVAKIVSNAHFQQEASKHYRKLNEEEKTEYVREVSPEMEMTKHDMIRKARKVMNHIHDKVGYIMYK